MVNMELMPSSATCPSSSSSSSSSSGRDTCTSSESSSSFSESNRGSNDEEKTNSGSVGGTKFVATASNQGTVGLESSLVDTVVCIETAQTPQMPPKPVESESMSNDTHTQDPLPYQDEEDDSPFFRSDDSLHSMPDKGPAIEQAETNNYGFKDEDLARLLDSPEVIKRCAITMLDSKPAPRGTAKARNSPDVDSSVCSDDHLEIPRPNTPERIAEASSRFVQKTDRPNGEDALQNKSQGHDTPFLESRNPEETRVPSYEAMSIRKQEEPTVVTEPRLERVSELDPSLYQPPPYRQRPDPIVHHLSIHNRPKSMRRTIPVRDLFSSPLHKLWLSKFDTFNHLQSEVANALAHSDDSIIVSAPTGAGKTALFEIAMARFFAADLAHNAEYSNGQVSNQRKIVYVAPSKALCEERYEDWTRRLTDINVGIQCAMITGDAEPGDSFRDAAAANVILTTPEKWDSLTRRWTENVFLFGTVKLLLLDEVHLLGDGTRGSCLESIVCRMKTIQRAATAASGSYDAHRMSR